MNAIRKAILRIASGQDYFYQEWDKIRSMERSLPDWGEEYGDHISRKLGIDFAVDADVHKIGISLQREDWPQIINDDYLSSQVKDTLGIKDIGFLEDMRGRHIGYTYDETYNHSLYQWYRGKITSRGLVPEWVEKVDKIHKAKGRWKKQVSEKIPKFIEKNFRRKCTVKDIRVDEYWIDNVTHPSVMLYIQLENTKEEIIPILIDALLEEFGTEFEYYGRNDRRQMVHLRYFDYGLK